jgi:hypothetical protein
MTEMRKEEAVYLEACSDLIVMGEPVRATV